jgi:lipoate-protein ligase A
VPWRLLLTPDLTGPDNMALDEALMLRARRTGETVLRVYGWATPTLSLGRNQRARGEYDEAALRRAGVGIVRRPTGGRALLHDHEITYSVTAPADSVESIPVAYERINTLLLTALDTLGVPAGIARPDGRAALPSAAPCFAEPATGELVFGNRKLVGSAQWRDGGALLQHGSILVDDDQSLISSFMISAVPMPPPPATLRSALGRAPGPEEVAEAMWSAVRTLADPGAAPLILDAESRLDAERLAERYRDPSWTWRR